MWDNYNNLYLSDCVLRPVFLAFLLPASTALFGIDTVAECVNWLARIPWPKFVRFWTNPTLSSLSILRMIYLKFANLRKLAVLCICTQWILSRLSHSPRFQWRPMAVGGTHICNYKQSGNTQIKDELWSVIYHSLRKLWQTDQLAKQPTNQLLQITIMENFLAPQYLFWVPYLLSEKPFSSAVRFKD